MNINEFVENFAEQFDEIDTSNFTAETHFRDNDDWSSMTALAIIAMVDSVFNVKITGDEIRASNTIQDIYTIVQSKLKKAL